MVLFYLIVEVAVGAVLDLAPQRTTNGARIGIMPIGGHPFRLVPNRLDRLFEEGLGRGKIAGCAKHGIDQIPFAVASQTQTQNQNRSPNQSRTLPRSQRQIHCFRHRSDTVL